MDYIIGIFVVIAGALLVIKAGWFVANFGTVEWAERHLGTEGGTKSLYKIIGIIAILITFLVLTGACRAILQGAIPETGL